MSINIFSVTGLIAWLETQDPETEYDFGDVLGNCLIARYARAMGTNFPVLHGHFFDNENLGLACSRPWTYGAALARAKAVATP